MNVRYSTREPRPIPPRPPHLLPEKGLAAPVTKPQGKGGHIRVYVGTIFTTARSGEIGRGLHREMLTQLNLPPDAF